MIGIVKGVQSGTDVDVVSGSGLVSRGHSNVSIYDVSAYEFVSAAHVGTQLYQRGYD